MHIEFRMEMRKSSYSRFVDGGQRVEILWIEMRHFTEQEIDRTVEKGFHIQTGKDIPAVNDPFSFTGQFGRVAFPAVSGGNILHHRRGLTQMVVPQELHRKRSECDPAGFRDRLQLERKRQERAEQINRLEEYPERLHPFRRQKNRERRLPLPDQEGGQQLRQRSAVVGMHVRDDHAVDVVERDVPLDQVNTQGFAAVQQQITSAGFQQNRILAGAVDGCNSR